MGFTTYNLRSIVNLRHCRDIVAFLKLQARRLQRLELFEMTI